MRLRDLMPWGRESRTPARRENRGGHPFFALQQEMNDLMEDFWRGSFGLDPFGRFGGKERFVPSVDVRDDGESLIVTAEVPGIEDKDLKVTLAADCLELSGEKRQQSERKEEGVYHSERSYGSFSRRIPLGCEVDADKVDAEFKNGVLTVRLPKTATETSRVRKIDVKSA